MSIRLYVYISICLYIYISIYLCIYISISAESLRRTFDMAMVSFSDFGGTYAGIRHVAKQFLYAENQEIN